MDGKGIEKLWAAYGKSRSTEIREQLIVEYAPLVKIVAGRLSMYLGYTVEYDDLVGYGILGLIDAIDKFDYLKGIKFETYASLRIRGAILDQIRKMDWIPRSIRQKQKKLEAALGALELQLGRVPTDEELANALSLTVEEYLVWQGQTKVSHIASLEDFLEQGADRHADVSSSVRSEQPERALEEKEKKQLLADTLKQLTEKERKVILLYYYEELTLKEISMVLEVSESRISQLHTKAIQKMRLKLGSVVELLMG